MIKHTFIKLFAATLVHDEILPTLVMSLFQQEQISESALRYLSRYKAVQNVHHRVLISLRDLLAERAHTD